MKNKKKLVLFIVILIFLIVICSLFFNNKTLKYKLKYDDNKFIIEEIYNKDNYYIKVSKDDLKYSFYIYERSDKKRKIVTDIYYYKDKSYECILPLINDEVKIDMVCYNDNIVYNYSQIIGEDEDLDKYVESIKIYNSKKYVDNLSKNKIINSIKLYTHNSIESIVAITTYKGLIVNNKEIELFKNDVYNNKISTYIDKYYIIADYDNNYEFQYFYVINMETNEVFKIKSKEVISLDSYIQGIVDNKVYLYDIDNENQYEIDIEKKNVKLISSNKYIKYYKNNKWEKMNKVNANKEIYFDYTSLDNNFTDYDEVLESDNYYYLFKEINECYKLYRVDKENIDVYKFIHIVPTTNINFKDDYLYYVDNNKLYYYSDNSGLITLLEYNELEFNNTIKYYIY
ncbi:MAG: hypothetical protein IJY25_05540 [Bacilli bacterium]|nr:hypothetical protein [Bacilli bacterium]